MNRKRHYAINLRNSIARMGITMMRNRSLDFHRAPMEITKQQRVQV